MVGGPRFGLSSTMKQILSKLLQVSCRQKTRLVLGIESTFDDSAAAVVDEAGKVLGDSIISQMTLHKRSGGVHPVPAQQMHRENLPLAVQEAMSKAGVEYKDLSAIATATQPGLSFSLAAGLEFSKQLIQKYKVPFIPVHHMEAHALTIRLLQKLDFPFLVLLASGGHCTLCLARGLGSYNILGHKLDEPPGAVFDKVARELGTFSDTRFTNMSGGQVIETLAKLGNEKRFHFSLPLSIGRNNRSCNFSFSGLQTQVLRTIQAHHASGGLDEQTRCDIAASFQRTVVTHITSHILRAVTFCRQRNLLPVPSTLVLSGGVASNSYFRESVGRLCEKLSVELTCPPPNLCTDNGIMIAWAGLEYLKEGIGIAENPMEVSYEPRSPIGRYIGDEVIQAKIKLPQKLLIEMGIR